MAYLEDVIAVAAAIAARKDGIAPGLLQKNPRLERELVAQSEARIGTDDYLIVHPIQAQRPIWTDLRPYRADAERECDKTNEGGRKENRLHKVAQ